jgi:hypothetical protein
MLCLHGFLQNGNVSSKHCPSTGLALQADLWTVVLLNMHSNVCLPEQAVLPAVWACRQQAADVFRNVLLEPE